MKDSVIKNFLVNSRCFFSTNIRKRINQNSQKIEMLEDAIAGLDTLMVERYHYLNILDYYARHEKEAMPYQEELAFLENNRRYCNFPYKPYVDHIEVESGFDEKAKLPFVIHKGKRLYFKQGCNREEAIVAYKNYVLTERILGDGEGEKAPHQYQSPGVRVNEGDLVFDIGAAEGLFALDQIDKASHVVIVESNPEWIEPLKHTFEPYGDKVTIIQKFVSATDTNETISLGGLLRRFEYKTAFVKMDIEGFELPSIIASESVLKERDLKFSIAAYHKQHDAEELRSLFERIGYYNEFSNGYMLFHLYDTPAPPYFRHGVIRTKKH